VRDAVFRGATGQRNHRRPCRRAVLRSRTPSMMQPPLHAADRVVRSTGATGRLTRRNPSRMTQSLDPLRSLLCSHACSRPSRASRGTSPRSVMRFGCDGGAGRRQPVCRRDEGDDRPRSQRSGRFCQSCPEAYPPCMRAAVSVTFDYALSAPCATCSGQSKWWRSSSATPSGSMACDDFCLASAAAEGPVMASTVTGQPA